MPKLHIQSNPPQSDVETGETGNPLRMIMYPARSERPDTPGSRMATHTDSGSVTLLFQRSAGLEVQAPGGNGKWVTAPHVEGCILVNIGDALSFWSERRLKATLHRVTFESLPFGQERQTMAYFAKARPETVLKPLGKDGGLDEYWSNRVKLETVMTVGKLTKVIMEGIYDGVKDAREGRVAVDT